MIKVKLLVLLFICHFQVHAYDLEIKSNEVNQVDDSYHLVYEFKNHNSTNYLFELFAKNENGRLGIYYKSTNIETNSVVDQGKSFFPSTKLSKLSISKKINGVVFNPESYSSTVIRLHGSEGGINAFSHAKALYMSLNGFSTMAYCYFDCPFGDFPKNLQKVELSYLYEQMIEFKKHGPVALWGASRGAELSSILATFLAKDQNLTEADAYVADRPAHVVVPAYIIYPTDDRSAQSWLWYGGDKEFVPYKITEIEKYRGAYLNLHGEADQIWPSTYSKILYSRYQNNNDDVEGFLHHSSSTAPHSNGLRQFHFFKETNHAFSSEWSQILRAEITRDFLEVFLD